MHWYYWEKSHVSGAALFSLYFFLCDSSRAHYLLWFSCPSDHHPNNSDGLFHIKTSRYQGAPVCRKAKMLVSEHVAVGDLWPSSSLLIGGLESMPQILKDKLILVAQ